LATIFFIFIKFSLPSTLLLPPATGFPTSLCRSETVTCL